MRKQPDVLIVGGGIIGLTAAYTLASAGVRVTVVDRGDLGAEASWAGAGILPPPPTPPHTPLGKLQALSAALFPELADALREETGIDGGYLRSGLLEFVAPDRPPTGNWHADGVRPEALSAEALRRLEPAVDGGGLQAYRWADTAQVRSPRQLRALEAACSRRGVVLKAGCPVEGFERRSGRILSAISPDGPLAAGWFLISCGTWSDTLLAPLGCRAQIHPVRGQIALLDGGPPVFQHMLAKDRQYLVPRAEGRVLVGSTEENVGFDKRTTAGAIASLLAFACRLVPALASAPVERCWAGLRPASPDGLPVIGLVPEFDNLFVAAGHFRAGIELSPGTAQLVTEQFLGQKLSVPLDAFRLDRPALREDSGVPAAVQSS